MSPESTKEYYAILIDLARKAFGEGSDLPDIIIYSINLATMTAHMKAGRHKEVVELLSNAVQMLHNAGAELVALTANTPHIFFDELQRRSPVPMLSIVQATFERASKLGTRKALLIGTRFTMASDMYPKAFAGGGIDVVVPDENERGYIDNAIRNELTNGVIALATKQRFIDIGLHHIKEEKVDSVVLGCTEIPLLLKEGDLPVPLLDTTRIHAEAIFNAAWTKKDKRRT